MTDFDLDNGVTYKIKPSEEYREMDQRMINLSKNVVSKIDKAISRIDEHIVMDHREDDIYNFLMHTKRGRVLCWLCGYKTKKLRDIIKLRKLREINSKKNKIRAVK